MKKVTKSLFCSYCRLLYDRHLVTGVGGNLSLLFFHWIM
jgi:ribulose-5-phosphate 4-epimerase/fuculose-1-phosphate aldolase